MPNDGLVHCMPGPAGPSPPSDPCILVIFGAAGDLCKRLLVPSLYNLACDRLLPERFAVVGVARSEVSDQDFRDRTTTEVQRFTTQKSVAPDIWNGFASRLYYAQADFGDASAYARLAERLNRLASKHGIQGNVIFYLATPPAVFETISRDLAAAGLNRPPSGWSRLIVEKPFGQDLASAIALSRALQENWSEEQIYRIDHYLGKETVQNLLAFRFSNEIFETLWNRNHIDHIQFTVSETVGVEARGKYYDRAGVIRDMIQNHMFQMLAYLCMEPPGSFRAESIRNEKAKLLQAVRIPTQASLSTDAVRGQYGPGRKPDGTLVPGYRNEPNVDPQSRTETFAALRLRIDNWRWDGVPIYLRSGKALWKRGTEIIVQFKTAPQVIFRDTPTVQSLDANKLVFHIQPDQGIEFRFHAKTPGPLLQLQKVNMLFDYQQAFETARGTGYEVLLYQCMSGDATLFSRSDLVESAWRIAQPILDGWAETPPRDFPNYPAGSWGPKAAYELIERDGRRWVEIINRGVLEKVPLFQGADPVLLRNLAMMLRPSVAAPGDYIIRIGETGCDMYFISRGQVEVLDRSGNRLATLSDGAFFGELSLLLSAPRTASIRAVTSCDLFVLDQADFNRAVKNNPQIASSLRQIAAERYPTSQPEVATKTR
jgi:glucose-6-phosphate 1-dehydrogenase